MPSISRLSIPGQLAIIAGLSLTMVLVTMGVTLQKTAELTFAERRAATEHMVEAARTVIQPLLDAAASGAMTSREAQAKALAALQSIRYDGKNYIFAYRDDGVTLLVPDKKAIGVNRMTVADGRGFLFVKAFIETAASGGGFVSYFYPKPGGSKPEPKLSYVLSVPSWRWVIGSGVYVDDVYRRLFGACVSVGLILIPLLLGFLVLTLSVNRSVASLIRTLTVRMRALAAGDLQSPIGCQDRSDEIGQMAKALVTFREAAIEKSRLEQNQAALAANADADRHRNDSERAAARANVEHAVAGLASALAHLSEGDLTFRLDQPFASDYETLRHTFNSAMDNLEQTLGEIRGVIHGLRSGAEGLNLAAANLLDRTEHQAASLEKTTGALNTVTATVRASADGASEAAHVVAKAVDEARASSAVVHEAVTAMKAIETSSEAIGAIIGVIDEIAFQTNLLALNAGVEAARAGDSGRGFAVVASEVRALAQRSADAARQIKHLIGASSTQVHTGVDRVDRTGQSLERLLSLVDQITQRVTAIAAAAADQAANLRNVNGAMNEIDQITQQNAAMVEQSTAASDALSAEAKNLSGLVARFNLRSSPSGGLGKGRARAA
jgi:methyl-accepting chemotaxis protein